MRLTIVPIDQLVIIDGVCVSGIDMSTIDDNIHAVQWYGSHGEVEFKPQKIDGSLHHFKPENKLIDDISKYQKVIEQWDAAQAG